MQQKFLFPLSNLNGFICYSSSQDYFFNTLKFLHIDDIVFTNAVLRVVGFLLLLKLVKRIFKSGWSKVQAMRLQLSDPLSTNHFSSFHSQFI